MKKLLLILLFVLTVLFSSCTQTVENVYDEIKLNSWNLTTDYGKKVTLTFEDDVAFFKIQSEEKATDVQIKGLCVIDNEYITIFDQNDKESYMFKYKLKNNKLTLSYYDNKITLTKNNC